MPGFDANTCTAHENAIQFDWAFDVPTNCSVNQFVISYKELHDSYDPMLILLENFTELFIENVSPTF